MVCYCCVKDCGNKSTSKKKDPVSLISFHAFPANPELKRKWLRAIGRSNWTPPNYARICSAHFNTDQISYVGYRPRVLDDALPVNLLPPNSYFEASNVEVCRICLATDVTLESLRETHLGSCMNSVAGCMPNYDVEGLPQYVCHQCAPSLIKCSELIQKCMTSQATLLDIFTKNGQVTKSLIKDKEQTQDSNDEVNLASTFNNSSSINDFLTKYEDVNNSPALVKTKSEQKASDNATQFKNEHISCIKIEVQDIEPKECKVELNVNEFNEDMLNLNELELNEDVLKEDVLNVNELELNEDVLNVNESELNEDEIKENVLIVNEFHIKELSEIDTVIDNDEDDDAEGMGTISSIDSFSSNEDLSSEISSDSEVEKKKKKSKLKPAKKKVAKRNDKGLTPVETEMLKYFDIVELPTLKEQIQEWAKSTTRRPVTCKNVYQCEICNKMFGNVVTYHVHATGHDPILGPAKCPVCKLRFKSKALAASHARRDHSKKFICKTCPKTFTNAGVAKKHHRLHVGHEYSCSLCPFVARHQSAVGVHKRVAHSNAHACARCGRAFHTARGLDVHLHAKHRTLHEEEVPEKYRCEQCNIGFASEEARRVHIMTSKQHMEKPAPDICGANIEDPSLRNCCKVCGQQCESLKELMLHKRAEHPGGRRARRSNHPWKGNVPYPMCCELCGETINTRRHHWHHMRRQHPKEVDTYQAVVTAICDVCGKGCQSTSMLRLHKLRHRNPTIRCQQCPRMFYDKYALIRHARTHKAEKPHQCRICGKAFKVPGNLDRHAKVHTDDTPFECTMCGKKFKYSSSVKLHVRTVHYKQPQPPRKKRSKCAKDAIDS